MFRVIYIQNFVLHFMKIYGSRKRKGRSFFCIGQEYKGPKVLRFQQRTFNYWSSKEYSYYSCSLFKTFFFKSRYLFYSRIDFVIFLRHLKPFRLFKKIISRKRKKQLPDMNYIPLMRISKGLVSRQRLQSAISRESSQIHLNFRYSFLVHIRVGF